MLLIEVLSVISLKVHTRGFLGGRGVLHLFFLSMRGFVGDNVEVPLLLFGVSGGQKVLEEFAHLF